ncbi:MAG TPA: glycosyltransferase family 39 protein [Pyrinomonadaceae bacterium]|nr:glycosyltransferase family 39 protein [Pyrinomonadaceae bacterium]
MNALLTILALTLGAAVLQLSPDVPFGASALILCGVLAGAAGLIVSQVKTDKTFLVRIFVGGLLVRMFIGLLIFHFSLQDFFGGDALTYDALGLAKLQAWNGDRYAQSFVALFGGEDGGGGGWGMLYLVASVYGMIGRNMLAIQFVNAVVGAATAPVIFLCARHIFRNLRVARIAAIFVAFYPSLVLWSSQGLKDGPIVFLLAVSMLATLRLGEQFNVKYLAILSCSLFALLSLRFYIFYIALAAIVTAFIIGMRAVTAQSLLRQVIIIVTLVLALTSLGVTRFAGSQLGQYADLSRIQRSRADASTSAQSGFAKDIDVSTASGALTAIPIGTIYLLFAPFPWQLASLRQSITLPEMLIWWASFPAMVLGIWFAIKYRFRQVLPILVFTFMLTIAYSLFQGNVGTAYRQRAQLLVFYFIFVAVGFVLLKERRDIKRLQQQRLAARQSNVRATARPSSSNI